MMPHQISIYCPADGAGLSRSELEEQLSGFFSDSAEDVGAGSGESGFNLDYELAAGEDCELWSNRLRAFLKQVGSRPGTVFDVIPDSWQPGTEIRRIAVWQ